MVNVTTGVEALPIIVVVLTGWLSQTWHLSIMPTGRAERHHICR